MQRSIDIKSSLKAIGNLLKPMRRHLPLLSILAISFYLIFGVFQVNQILQTPSDQSYQLEQQKDAVKTRFDAATIDQIEKLKSRSENTNLDLPSGKRIDPFSE